MSAYTKDPEFFLRWPDFRSMMPDPQDAILFLLLALFIFLEASAIVSKFP